MSDGGEEGAAVMAVAALSAAVDDLLTVPVTSLPGLALIELAALVETQLRRLPTFDHALVAAITGSGVHADVGARSTAAVLVHALRVSPAEAAARVRAAKELGPRVDFTGGVLAPLFPVVAAAQADGGISVGHARVITSTVDGLPSTVRAEHGEAVEAFLVGQAAEHAPDQVARIARHASAVLDPDGTLASEEDQQRRRGLALRVNADGSSDLHGRLTPECATVLAAVLDPLTAPQPAKAHTTETETDTTGPAGIPDPRSYPQRMHDALLDAARRLLGSGALPDTGGAPATVLVTLTLDQLESRVGAATISRGGTLTIPAALRLAAEAEVIPVVLAPTRSDHTGGVLAYGRARRHATPAQRRALTARDGGCSFPGCDAPPGWTEAHHVQHWADGGRTDLNNLTLVCGFHHREHQHQGWQCQITDGFPYWTPPHWIDPQRKPRRNTSHHPTRYLPDAA